MIMATEEPKKIEVTPEQQKKLNELGMKYLISSFFNGVHHCLMLLAVNIVTYLAILVLQGPEWVLYATSAGAAIFIFKRMASIGKESHDRLIKEVKKLLDLP